MNPVIETTPTHNSFRLRVVLPLVFGVLLPLHCFGWLTEAIWNRGGLEWDVAVVKWIHQYDSAGLDKVVIALTQTGDITIVILFAVVGAIALLVTQRKRDERFLARSIVGAAVIVYLAKAAFYRVRSPLWESLPPESELGSPSVHAMGSFALALTLSAIAWPTRWRWPVMFAGSFYAVSIALSRLYLGVHQASDVMATWALALAWVSGLSVLQSAALSYKKKLALLGLSLLASLVAILAGYISSDLRHDNLRVLVTGQAYRSGQMNDRELTQAIERYNIKSILNLRGENLAKPWHQAEIATTAKLNVTYYDRSLSSGKELSLEEMDDLIALLCQAPKPVLIHCLGGADRSGLVSALYLFALEGRSSDKAVRELSIWNGHVPLIRPKVTAMDNSFWRYASNRLARTNLIVQPKPLSP